MKCLPCGRNFINASQLPLPAPDCGITVASSIVSLGPICSNDNSPVPHAAIRLFCNIDIGVKSKPLNVAFGAIHHLAPRNPSYLSCSCLLQTSSLVALLNPLPAPCHAMGFQTLAFDHSLILAAFTALPSPGELLSVLQGQAQVPNEASLITLAHTISPAEVPASFLVCI